MSTTAYNPYYSPQPTYPAQGSYPAAQQPAYPSYPGAPVTPPGMGQDSNAVNNLGNGPILPGVFQKVTTAAANIVPAATEAAVGAARAIASNPGSARAMAPAVEKIVQAAGEPLVRLSWGFVSDLVGTIGSIVTFNIPGAVNGIGSIFSDGAINTANIFRKLVQPAVLTKATAGGTRSGMASAMAVGIKGGALALKSSFIWAIPASAVNAFIDYKYHDQADKKRLLCNFAADVVGYTATGMAGAAIGAAVGSMTMPIVGTLVGAGVGILLGLAHDHYTRPLISNWLVDHV